MGSKIYVSYKYADEDVEHLREMAFDERTTVRDYVDVLACYNIGRGTNIYKGEREGEDLSQLSGGTIRALDACSPLCRTAGPLHVPVGARGGRALRQHCLPAGPLPHPRGRHSRLLPKIRLYPLLSLIFYLLSFISYLKRLSLPLVDIIILTISL